MLNHVSLKAVPFHSSIDVFRLHYGSSRSSNNLFIFKHTIQEFSGSCDHPWVL